MQAPSTNRWPPWPTHKESPPQWIGPSRVVERNGHPSQVERDRHAEDVLHSIADAIVTTDRDSRVTYMNPVAERLTGWTAGEAIGHRLCDVMPLVAEESRAPIACMAERCLRAGRSVDLEMGALLVRRDGSEIPVGDSAGPIHTRDGETVGVVLVVQDESEQRRVGRRLSFDATHDALTGLVNRREFERQLTLLMSRPHAAHALLYLDLDRFKQVNDTFGHEAGDTLLRAVGPIMSRQLRTSDTLARLGGDEFGVLLVNCALDDADHVADGIRRAIDSWQCAWAGTTLSVGISIGLLSLATAGADTAAVMRAADAACYQAKALGGRRVCQSRWQCEEGTT